MAKKSANTATSTSWTEMAAKPKRSPGRPAVTTVARSGIVATRMSASEREILDLAAQRLRATGAPYSLSSIVKKGALDYAARVNKR